MHNRDLSRFLSLILRHKPQTIGLTLDKNGWADLDELMQKMQAHGRTVSRAQIEAVVADNDKQRFKLDLPHNRIRANQGHSIDVALELKPQIPPPLLYHGTADRFLDSILARGLEKRNRQHVHLSAQRDTAVKVGSRHGQVVVLLVDAGAMQQAGHVFYQSDNGVWLTDAVPPGFLRIED